MKKTLAAATVAALVGVAGAANAADIYAPAGGSKDVYVPAPTWTGFYIGGAVGGAWADIKNTDDNGFFDYGKGYRWYDDTSGVLGGATLGYNYQFSGAFVAGIEIDLDGISLSHPYDNVLYSGWSYNNNNGAFLFDVTGRLGYAFGPALIYAKGGYAYVDTSDNLRYAYSGYNYGGNNSGLDGWVVGAGLEYALSPSWSVKIEYLYYDFTNKNQNISWTSGTGETLKNYCDPIGHEVDINTFKVGFNYHVGNVYTPLK
jgi:outer membrane immunogenic protein